MNVYSYNLLDQIRTLLLNLKHVPLPVEFDPNSFS